MSRTLVAGGSPAADAGARPPARGARVGRVAPSPAGVRLDRTYVPAGVGRLNRCSGRAHRLQHVLRDRFLCEAGTYVPRHPPVEAGEWARSRAALRPGRDIVVTSVTLAELYRGRERTRALDALLTREGRVTRTRDTDRVLARLVGALRYAAGSGSALPADAHAVAAAVEVDGGIVLAAGPDDLSRLAAGTPR